MERLERTRRRCGERCSPATRSTTAKQPSEREPCASSRLSLACSVLDLSGFSFVHLFLSLCFTPLQYRFLFFFQLLDLSSLSGSIKRYRKIIRASRLMPNANRRDFIKFRARREYDLAVNETDLEKIEFHLRYGETQLESIFIQVRSSADTQTYSRGRGTIFHTQFGVLVVCFLGFSGRTLERA